MPQDQTGNQFGPFTSALVGPLTPQVQKQDDEPIGYGGKAASIAQFANKFLEGARAGQRTAYERSEQQKMEQDRNFDSVMAYIQASPELSKDAKDQAQQIYLQQKIGRANGALGGVDKSLKDHPLINFAKSVVGAAIGPGKNDAHKTIDANALLTIATDPRNRINPEQMGQDAASKLAEILPRLKNGVPGTAGSPAVEATPEIPGTQPGDGGDTGNPGVGYQPARPAQAAVAATPAVKGIPLTKENVLAHREVQKALAPLVNQGINPLTHISVGPILNALPTQAQLPKPLPGAPLIVPGPKNPDGTDGPAHYSRGMYDPVTGEITYEDAGEVAAKPNASHGLTRNVGEPTTIPDAIASGQKYENALAPGSFFDLEHLQKTAPNMQLRAVSTPTGLKFILGSADNKFVTVGNHTYAVNSREAQQLMNGAGVDLGLRNAGTAREVQGVDAQGNPIAQTLISTPNSPGIAGRTAVPAVNSLGGTVIPRTATPPVVSAPQRTAPSAQTGTVTPPAQTPKQQASGGVPLTFAQQAAALPSTDTAPPPTVGTRPLGAMTAATRKDALARVTPVRSFTSQMFGDPNHPETKGLVDYAYLADDPVAGPKIGRALELAFSDLHKKQDASGGFTEWAKNETGATGAIAESRAKVLNEARQDLASTPGALDAFNAVLSAYGSAIGLRAITKASGSKSSAEAIERDLPNLFKNTTGSRDFYDKALRYAQEVNDGVKGVSPLVFEKNERNLYSGGIQKQLGALKNSAPDPSIKAYTSKKTGTRFQVGQNIVNPRTGKTEQITGIGSDGTIQTNYGRPE